MNLSKTLEELENDKWEKAAFGSNLVKECHRLRSVPLSELSIENLRMLIGQKIGLDFLVPVALEALNENPLVEGGLYKGDLLASVAAIPEDFWQRNPELNNQIVEIKNELEIALETITEELLPALSSKGYI